MKWHRLRVQVLSAGMAALLMVMAVSLTVTTPSKAIASAPDARSLSLAALHRQGDLIQKQRQAAVLAASTALVPDCTKMNCIALTFDDGPNPLTTPQVVSILETEHVTATFFMIGSRVPGNEALLQRIHADGDEIGNHSWSHPDLTKLPFDQVKQQIQQTQDVIIAAGVPAPTLFRPPYGALNSIVRSAVAPLTLALWNEDPKDWAAKAPDQVLAASAASAKSGGVIDMHDIYHVTANSLQPLITNLKSRNFTFVTMSQLLASYPAAGEFYGGYHP